MWSTAWIVEHKPCRDIFLTNQRFSHVIALTCWLRELVGQCPDLVLFLYRSYRDRRITLGVDMYLPTQPLVLHFKCASIQAMTVNCVADSLPYPNVVALSVSLFFSYVVATAVYRLYFHPLAKFPGPIWAKLTTFPAWWHSKNQDRHLWLLSLQDQYGPEFRYAPNGVCLNTPSAYRHIFGPRGNVKKSEYYQVWPKTVDHINTWSATSIPAHARKRRVINYAFSESALRGAEVFVHANVDRWLELLGQQRTNGNDWTASINMADQVTYLVFDILGDLCFGKCFDMKEPSSELRHIPELMIGYMELIHPVSEPKSNMSAVCTDRFKIACSPASSLYVWLKPKGLDRLLAAVTPPAIQKWTEFVDDCLAKRTSKQKELKEKPKPDAEVRKDFFHWLFNATDPETGTGYSLPELYAECELLTIAGSDTTAIVISAAYFYLSRSPKAQEKLAREILLTFNNYEEIVAGPKLQSCRYLTAFLNEAMRMSPPVPAEPSREVLEGGTTVNGHYFPKGSLVSTALWAMHYNKDYYPSPLEFRPERWIVGEDDSTAESVALAESAFCAFSSGSRGCVGKNMAWLEMRIVMAKTLWKYEIKQDLVNKLGGGSTGARPGRREEGQYQTYEMFVSNRKGPMVQLKERTHSEKVANIQKPENWCGS
ncbi:uncharacterized protein EKO05_0002756 [Ascochyta rabiei]|uniref:uncharacterized protein n=1 Tax=Didymella rabiei TaxID=5454 RepID=UPI00220D4128|nr:uncharacterized protein EKO05_0002756 [Ascochyta rabiei]UPX12193.1 hypothetical protein EKO05_0002756 [Ascochyta rabiei]